MHLHAAIPVKLNSGFQASDLLLVLGDDVREDGVLSGRDLLRQLDVLGEGGLALLDRALEVDVLDGVAQVGGLLDDGDQAVLDLQVHLGAVLDIFGEVTAGGDGENLAAESVGQYIVFLTIIEHVDSRLRRVGVQVDALEVQDVVLGVLAVGQRVVSGNGQ